jgi:oxygen-independent coproporphyrinogen-3 oxidase
MSASAVETGSLFVSNYPPFPLWTDGALEAVAAAVAQPPSRQVPLGVYAHIPFCRKRCRFCYFKVETEVAADEVQGYVESLLAEARAWAGTPVAAGREVDFLYVGGGTPSYLSNRSIASLLDGLREALPLAAGAEVTFECEPGTVRPEKMATLRAAGVTRVSLGVESFDDAVLDANGRAHDAKHIAPAFAMARDAGFTQINLDLIAGMVGESKARFLEGVAEAVALGADSVTIYQMEVPGNTAVFRDVRDGVAVALPSWAERRAWATEAFAALEASGYRLSSGYTAVRGPQRFVYRDSLWHGADLLPLGVSAFGHIQGVHVQNHKDRATWRDAVGRGTLGWQRGYAMTPTERLVREAVLQLKLGGLDVGALAVAHGLDAAAILAPGLQALADGGWLVPGEGVRLRREAWMRVDTLLPSLFLTTHGGRTEAA